jgi:NADH:ubiquinone oxidoreductase subunit 5 (subunit L)/multisubunit Na+/H+ antiporter MnhA subunit
MHEVLYNKWFVDEIYFALFINNLLRLNNFLSWFDGKVIDGVVNLSSWIVRIIAFFYGAIDKYIVDGLVKGVSFTTIFTGNKVTKLQTGRLQTYVVGLSAGLVLIMIVRYILL